MKKIEINPGSLLATEGTFLDMGAVKAFYDRFKRREETGPVIVVKEPKGSYYYPADGNHTSYAGFLADIAVKAILLETDEDVRSHDFGPTKRFPSLSELLMYCRQQNAVSRRELGVDYIGDYASLHHTRLH